VEKSIRQSLGDWKRGVVPAPAAKPVPEAENMRISLIDVPKFNQSVVLVGKSVPARSAPDYQALVIANQVLGGDVGTRLNQAVAQENLKAGALISSINSKKSSASFMIMGRAMTESADRLLAVILEQIRRLSQDEVTFAEFDRARNFLYGNLPLQLDAAASDAQATLVMFSRIFELPENYWTTYNARMQKVTRQDLRAACQRHLAADKLSVVVLGDGKKLLDSLRAIAPVDQFTLEGKSRE